MNNNNNELVISFYERERFNNQIEPCMRAIFPEYFNIETIKANIDMSKKVFEYAVYKFYIKQLTQGEVLKQEIFDIGYPFKEEDIFLVEYIYEDNLYSGIINPMINKTAGFAVCISPCMTITGDFKGFTVSPGCMSDFHIFEQHHNPNMLWGYTRDFMQYTTALTAVFLDMYMKLFKSVVVDKEIPSDFEEIVSKHYILQEEYRNLAKKIKETIKEKYSRNKSVRIDRVSVDGKNIFNLMLEYKVGSIFSLRSESLLKISMELGKPPRQVYKDIEKIFTV